jgi:hypothetical protein
VCKYVELRVIIILYMFLCYLLQYICFVCLYVCMYVFMLCMYLAIEYMGCKLVVGSPVGGASPCDNYAVPLRLDDTNPESRSMAAISIVD